MSLSVATQVQKKKDTRARKTVLRRAVASQQSFDFYERHYLKKQAANDNGTLKPVTYLTRPAVSPQQIVRNSKRCYSAAQTRLRKITAQFRAIEKTLFDYYCAVAGTDETKRCERRRAALGALDARHTGEQASYLCTPPEDAFRLIIDFVVGQTCTC